MCVAGATQSFAEFEGEVQPATAPPSLAAWTITRPRFERSFAIHIARLIAAWVFGRRFRRPAPRAVPGTLVPAPLFRRLLALLTDLAVAGAVLLPIRFSVLTGAEFEYWMRHMEEAQQSEAAAVMLWDTGSLFVILFTGYVTIAEAAFGRTIGKWLFELRVIELDGGPASLGASAARGLFHVLDTLQPLTWPMTIILLLWRRQRLGDFWAHTLVVRQLR